MRRWIAAGALGVALVAATALRPGEADTIVPPQTPGTAPQQAAADPALVAKGEYLVHLGDCDACHTANGGAKFAGGQLMNMPFGAISTPNITPDVKTGIGNYTDAGFIHLMRTGVTPDGTHIYPAMPYPWFTKLGDDDLLAIKAYLFSLAPVDAPRQPNPIWFPFNLRPVLAVWDWAFVPSDRWKPDPKLNDQQNRGSFIVNTLEHCGECHNHRNLLGNTGLEGFAEGGPIQLWYAPNLHSDKDTGLGRYSDADLFQYLKEGWSPGMGPTAGPMGQTIGDSVSKLHDEDVHAIVAYLRTLPATAAYPPTKINPATGTLERGSGVYLSHCASCHQVDGKGLANAVPALDGNGAVRSAGGQNIVRAIMEGLEARGPYGVMPAVGNAMSDQDVADVTNYVRQAWSNAAPANTGKLTAFMIRDDAKTMMNGRRPDGCPTLVEPKLLAAMKNEGNGLAALVRGVTPPTMLQTSDAIVQKMKQLAPDVPKADVVNGMMIAYCGVIAGNQALSPEDRAAQITNFGDRLYVQLSTGGSY